MTGMLRVYEPPASRYAGRVPLMLTQKGEVAVASRFPGSSGWTLRLMVPACAGTTRVLRERRGCCGSDGGFAKVSLWGRKVWRGRGGITASRPWATPCVRFAPASPSLREGEVSVQGCSRRLVTSVRRVGRLFWMMFQIVRLVMLSYSWMIRFRRPMIV